MTAEHGVYAPASCSSSRGRVTQREGFGCWQGGGGQMADAVLQLILLLQPLADVVKANRPFPTHLLAFAVCQ
jgi:hypothetical protein